MSRKYRNHAPVKLVAISGWKRSGKDTIAEHLISKYNYTRVSFAEKLKDMTASIYQVPRHWMDDQKLKEEPLPQYPAIPTDSFSEWVHSRLSSELVSGYWTPRALLILEGSAKRSVNSNYWVSKVVEEIRASEEDQVYCITDLRYKSEADSLRMLFGDSLVTVRVNRFSDPGTNESSERDLDDYYFDYTINNTGSLEDLEEILDTIMEDLCNA